MTSPSHILYNQGFEREDPLSNYNDETIEQLATVIDYVRFAASEMERQDLFFGHGTDNSWDDAIALVFHSLALPVALGQKVMHAKLTKSERIELLALISKRIEQQIPTPYLTNHARFCELDFYVDERVLIPRSPIAELIQSQFSPWLEFDKVNNILELCTGSGCISIALAYAFEHAFITATDISLDALDVAALNVEAHGLEQQISLIESNVYQQLPEQQYDLIVANPPYVSDEEMTTLPAEYHHEPSLALRADDHGLDIVIQIIKGAKSRLTEAGILVVEVGNSEFELQQKYPEVPFTWLEFERGGSGVFMLSYQQLQQYF